MCLIPTAPLTLLPVGKKGMKSLVDAEGHYQKNLINLEIKSNNVENMTLTRQLGTKKKKGNNLRALSAISINDE